MLGKFYQKMQLDFPPSKRLLKSKIKRLTREMYKAMMKKVIQTNRLKMREGEWVEDTEGMWKMGEEYLAEGEDAGSVY